MTLVVRATALRFLAIVIPLAVGCWGGLTLSRFGDVPVGVSPTAACDLGLALLLGVGGGLVHVAALRLAPGRPARGALLVFAGLPLGVVLAVAQVTYARGTLDDGVEGGFALLSILGRSVVEDWPRSSGALVGVSAALALPVARDLHCRLSGEPASPGQGLLITITIFLALVGVSRALQSPVLAFARDTWWHQSLLAATGVAALVSLFVGLPLVLLLAGAERVEVRYRAG